jgi:nucleotide-binding universal stress UspA family protein
MHIENILFPVDFSERSSAAAPFVLSIAQRYQARVVAIHVVQPPPPLYAGMNTIYPATYDFEGIANDLKVELKRFVEAQLPKIETSCEVQMGDPGVVISQYACTQNMSLIAIPTHGYGTFRRALLGSVTAKVLHDSTLPIWTSAHAPEPSHRAHPKPRYILCAVDLKPESRKTLETAIEVAGKNEAKLELFHVPADGVPVDSAEERMQQMLIEAAGRELIAVEDADAKDQEPEVAMESGSIAEMVRKLALRKRADLVIIGRGSIRSGLGRLHANSYDIIRESPCPVLSV